MMRNITAIILTLSVVKAAGQLFGTTTPAPKDSLWDTLSNKMKKLDVSWPPKTAIRADMRSPMEWPLNPKGSLGCKWDNEAGGVKCALNSTHFWPEAVRTNGIALEKTIGSMCCKLQSDAQWPPKPTASVRGTVKVGQESICYDLKSPLEDFVVSGTVSMAKEIGSSLCTLQSPVVWPPKPAASIKHTFKDAGNVCCTLKTGPIDTSTMDMSPTGTVEKTFETDFGSFCCKAHAGLSSYPEPSGSVTLKKKIGAVCANLEASTSGQIRCTLNSSWSGMLAQRFVNIVSVPAVGATLAGVLAGAGLAAAVLRARASRALSAAPVLGYAPLN
jgi:hypothetical protein